MQCPRCGSIKNRKNGVKQGQQNHICVECGRQFIDQYEPDRTYSEEFKQECLTMAVNGMGLRGIERVKGVHHTTLMSWVKQLGKQLPDAPEAEQIPEVGELDELETSKPLSAQKNKIWLWTAVDHFRAGILGWVLGDHSSETFRPLWVRVGAWLCYFYITDGWSVYPCFIPEQQFKIRHYMGISAFLIEIGFNNFGLFYRLDKSEEVCILEKRLGDVD